MRISVHILTKDRPSECALCLLSLRQQSFKGWDLIIVDESETQIINYKFVFDVLNRIRTEGHYIKYVRNSIKGNIGKSRNLAIENDDLNELILRVDDDEIMNVDYMQRLHDCYVSNVDNGVVAIGGVVPPCGNPKVYRKPPKIFNEIKVDKDGNIVYMADDGGYCYMPDTIVPSHHLRSSFLFSKQASIKAGNHPLEYGITGYREETDFSIKLQMPPVNGKLLTDTGAVCWHAHARSGGSHSLNPQDYQQAIQLNHEHFNRKFKRLFNQKGVPEWITKS